MEFFDAVRKRRSVRKYKDRPIPDEKLQALLEAVRLAPSAGDLQAFEVVLVREAARRRKLGHAAYGQHFIGRAPVVLVFLASPARSAVDYGHRGEELYCIQDATIACTHAHLAAAAAGLGSTWVGAFDEDAVRRIVGAPANLRPVALLPIGVPAESPAKTPRRTLKDLVREESF
jgi:nitroreductase